MPQDREKIDPPMPGGREFFGANARGCPGGMVRVGIEGDVGLTGASCTRPIKFLLLASSMISQVTTDLWYAVTKSRNGE